VNQIDSIDLDGSVDPHVHGRDDLSNQDGRMELVVPLAEAEHEDVVLILNTPAIVTSEGATEYLRRARRHQRPGSPTRLHAAPLLTDQTTPEMIHAMRRNDDVAFIKGFLKGVSNDGSKSVSNVRALRETLYACHDPSIDAPAKPVDWHMERKFDRKGGVIAVRNREWYAIRNDFAHVLEVDPEGNHAVKHVSDARTAARIQKLRREGYNVYAEFAPHYFIRCFEDLFEGAGGGTAFRANEFCVPVYKSRDSQLKLIKAAFVGAEEGWAFIGSDCACHADDPKRESGVKISSDGLVCPGAAIVPAHSKAIVIDLFVKRGKPDLLNNILSRNARARLGFPAARTVARYVREERQIPDTLPEDKPFYPIHVQPFMKGQHYDWVRKA